MEVAHGTVVLMPDIVTIQDAMAKVMGDVREVAKNDRNTQQNFPFRGIDAVVNAVAPALRRHGVVVLPRLEDATYENVVVGAKQTHMIGCRVRVTYRFVGPGGDWLDATVAGEAMDAGDKATAKAMSVAFRIALLQALVLPTDDVDPDATSYERGPSGPGSAAMPVPSRQADRTSSTAQGVAVDRETSVDDVAGNRDASGEAAEVSHYLTKDDQNLLKVEFNGQANAIKAYQARFPNVRRLADITYEMRDRMMSATDEVRA